MNVKRLLASSLLVCSLACTAKADTNSVPPTQPPQGSPFNTNAPATDLGLSPEEVKAIKEIEAAAAVLGTALLAYFKTFIAARLLRKAIPDRMQANTFGKVLAHWALEINPIPGTVPTAVQPASMPSVVVPAPQKP